MAKHRMKPFASQTEAQDESNVFYLPIQVHIDFCILSISSSAVIRITRSSRSSFPRRHTTHLSKSWYECLQSYITEWRSLNSQAENRYSVEEEELRRPLSQTHTQVVIIVCHNDPREFKSSACFLHSKGCHIKITATQKKVNIPRAMTSANRTKAAFLVSLFQQ